MFQTSIKASVQKSVVCALIAAFGFTGPALAIDIKYFPPGSKLQPIYAILLGRDALSACSSLTFDKVARQIRLSCRAAV